MTQSVEGFGPTEAVARSIKALRRLRGLTGAGLAERMTAAGVPWDRSIVANLENGRRRTVSVEELLALAYVLDVAPVHLLVPPDDDDPFHLTPSMPVTPADARAFIRGERAPDGVDPRSFHSTVPRAEFDFAASLAGVERFRDLSDEDKADLNAAMRAGLPVAIDAEGRLKVDEGER